MVRNNNRIIYMRKSVNQALNDIGKYPLAVVTAPMGYGKTTAVREFLESSGFEVLWQTLLNESVSGFWNGFSRLFRKLDPVAADSLAKIGVPVNSVFLEEGIRILSNIEFSARTVIVLDDYHLLSSGDIDSFIEQMVKSELPNLHIVIISRSVFGENTAELVLKGYCSVIEKRHLELTRDEIVEYCMLCGVKLTNEDTNFLLAYSEGWISAIYLCIRGFLQDGRIEHQGSLYELIEKVVYRHCSAELQGFLLALCIFDSFSFELAESMWRKENTAVLLQSLVTQNAFFRQDHVSGMYYVHNIFTSYLRRIFDRQSPDLRQATWKTAGNWYKSVGDCIQAMDCFYKAADFDELLSVFEANKGNVITNEHKESVIRYFSECPAQIKMQHPWACLIYAINLFSFNEMELFGQQCNEIAGYIEHSPGLDEQSRVKMAGELEILIGFTKYNSISGMSAHNQRAWELLHRPAEFIDRNGSWTFGSPSVLYMFYRESGKLAQEVQEIFEAMPYYYWLTSGHGSGAEYVMQAERYYHIGDFENAEITAHKALYIAQSQNQAAIELCARFLQLRLALLKGDLSYVTDSLRETREEIKTRGLYLYFHTWDMCEGYVYSYLKETKKIPAWIVEGDLQNSAIYFPSYAFFNIIRVKALLIGGQYLKVSGLAGEFIAIASVFPNLLGQVYIYIYEAVAKFKLDHHADALETLRKALDIAAPDEVIMPFVENGEYIDEMLAILENNAYHPEFTGKIGRLFSSIKKHKEAMAAKLNRGNGELLLTEREWAIAELVATGLSNQAIGKTLHIAEITVKKALQSIYAKLGINNRTALTKIIVEQKAAG